MAPTAGAQKPPDDHRIGKIIRLLKQVSDQHRYGKADNVITGALGLSLRLSDILLIYWYYLTIMDYNTNILVEGDDCNG